MWLVVLDLVILQHPSFCEHEEFKLSEFISFPAPCLCVHVVGMCVAGAPGSKDRNFQAGRAEETHR